MDGCNSDIRFRSVAPAIEFVCWNVVVLTLFLRLVNGPAVTDDQFVFQIALFTIALLSGIALRLYQRFHHGSRSVEHVQPAGVSCRTYWERLSQSFAAMRAAVEVPQIARRAIIILLISHTALLAYSAFIHSPTLNEPGHLAAGLIHWKFGRFDAYRVNPPLVRMVASLPVIAVDFQEDWSGFSDSPGARPEMTLGEHFIKANGERSFLLFTLARWACIPFSWTGAIVCYLWARDLNNRASGILACAFWCFEPNILAHAALITPDAGATALGLAACYTFWRWLLKPTWLQAILTGVVLGLAELAKTTLILFYPLWPLMWFVYRWPDRGRLMARDWTREAAMLAARMAIGLYVLNLGYGFQDSFRQLQEYQFVSDLFTGRAASTSHSASPSRNSPLDNRFADSCLGPLPIPFPKNYVLGLDTQQRDFEHYGRPSYLHGEWREHGWWYYYLYAFAIKVPVGFLALGTIALFGCATSFLKIANRCSLELRDYFILLFPACVIFVVVSAKYGFSEHLRYVLPAFPYFYVAIASGVINCLTLPGKWLYFPASGQGGARMPLFLTICVGLFGSWFVLSSLWIYPHSLSYFNEVVGGPLNGSKHLLGSNLDWGQDLRYLKRWIDSRPIKLPVIGAYYGSFDPRLVGVDLSITDKSQMDAAATTPVQLSRYAVSANILAGDPWSLGDAAHFTGAEIELLERRPCRNHVGYSIIVWDVDPPSP